MIFLKRYKYLIMGVLFLMLTIAAPFLKEERKPSCEQPQVLLVKVTQHNCFNALDPMMLNAVICDQVKNESYGCELGEAERPAGEKIIKDMVNQCVDEVFKANYICIDKYQRL